MFKIYFSICLILILERAAIGLPKNRVAYFNKIGCPKPYLNVIADYNCSLVKSEIGETVMNVGLLLKEDLTNITLKMKITGTRLNRQVETFINMNLDVCEALGAIHEHYILKLATAELRRVSNLPYACPLKKDIRYQVNHFRIDFSLLPPYIPEMDWAAYYNFFVNNRKAMTFTNQGKIARASASDLKKTYEFI